MRRRRRRDPRRGASPGRADGAAHRGGEGGRAPGPPDRRGGRGRGPADAARVRGLLRPEAGQLRDRARAHAQDGGARAARSSRRPCRPAPNRSRSPTRRPAASSTRTSDGSAPEAAIAPSVLRAGGTGVRRLGTDRYASCRGDRCGRAWHGNGRAGTRPALDEDPACWGHDCNRTAGRARQRAAPPIGQPERAAPHDGADGLAVSTSGVPEGAEVTIDGSSNRFRTASWSTARSPTVVGGCRRCLIEVEGTIDDRSPRDLRDRSHRGRDLAAARR